ncbi:MAG: hypothetical protein KDA60_20080, partial [Planctomycetales bacterium]|nr:hypothetical protein [Planctomycetales bacterium]
MGTEPTVGEPTMSIPDGPAETMVVTSDVAENLKLLSEVKNIQTLHALPRTRLDIEYAHERNRGNACELISSGEPFQLSDFTPYLTQRDERRGQRETLIPSTRRHVLSVGLDMLKVHHKSLPALSRGQILSYMKNHFVSIQARVQRDPLTHALYLHHRPLAATARYGRSRLTEEFTDAVLSSIREMRSLGIYLEEGVPPTPDQLRTIVMTHKNTQTDDVTKLRYAKPDYEFVFVRARSLKVGEGVGLALHAFATTERRKYLHYLYDSSSPSSPTSCGIKGTVYFTEFTRGVYPEEAVILRASVRGRKTYSMQELDDYAHQAKPDRDALDQLNLVLDAIIDGLVPEPTQPAE